ncbi:MAG: GFA family protein [Alphaproteobacteria bacterium]
MTAPFQGGCRCGQLRYEATAEPIFFGHCHCRDCQYASGAGFSSILAVPKDAFNVLQGDYAEFDLEAESGNMVSRKFCAHCGTPLFSELKAAPDIWIIKAGTLDDPSWLQAGMQIWCDSAQPWATLTEGIPTFGKNPEM